MNPFSILHSLIHTHLAMDDFLLQSLAVLALFFLYHLWRSGSSSSISNNTKPMSPQPPEPSGAFPILGHLPLLSSRVPLGRSLSHLADKYGPIYKLRFGVHSNIIVSTLEVMKDCFTHDKVFSTRPPSAAGRYLGYNNAFLTLAPHGPYWREIKKMMTLELLSKSRLEMLKPIVMVEVESCIKELHSYWAMQEAAGPVMVEINRWFCRLNLNVIMKIVVGKRYVNTFDDAKDDDEVLRLEKAIEEHTRLTGTLVLSDMLPYIEWMDLQGHLKAMKCLAKELDILLENWLEDHHKKKKLVGDEKDFMDVMLSKLPEDKLICGYDRDTVVKAIVLNLVVGGTETTGQSLTWALSLLLNHPDVLKRAQDELDAYVGKDRQVEDSDIKSLVYLQAIAKETLRLYPAAPVLPHRAMEDCEVGGYHVSKGTVLLMNVWKLHRDPTVWLDPDEFRPERFLTTHANVDFMAQKHGYIPFSAGRRICPGLPLAMQVFHLTLARLLHGFDVMSPLHAPVDMSEGVGITLPKANPLQVLLTPRLPSKLYEN